MSTTTPGASAPYQSCIDACIRCAQACEVCHEACLNAPDVTMMAACIRLDKDCSQACWNAAAYMSRTSPFAKLFCRVCAEVCETCGKECAQHEAD